MTNRLAKGFAQESLMSSPLLLVIMKEERNKSINLVLILIVVTVYSEYINTCDNISSFFTWFDIYNVPFLISLALIIILFNLKSKILLWITIVIYLLYLTLLFLLISKNY